MVDLVLQPMRDLLARYRSLAPTLSTAIAALESGLGEADAEIVPTTPEQLRGLTKVETPTGDLSTILAFQERLAELEDVLKVTVTGSTSSGTTFFVELAPAEPQNSRNKVVCSSCGRLISEGVDPPSHGLCDECAGSFPRTLR